MECMVGEKLWCEKCARTIKIGTDSQNMLESFGINSKGHLTIVNTQTKQELEISMK